ncbi:hypothetical protein GGF37_005115, partial [Kickxella alabastrina]
MPTLSVGGLVNGGDTGYKLGASATLGGGGRVLPSVAFGGGFAGAINQLVANIAGSVMVYEGGWLNGLVPTASVGVSAGGQAG